MYHVFANPSQDSDDGRHSFLNDRPAFAPAEDEIDDIIKRMRALDVFEVDKVCWKMLTGVNVTSDEKRKLQTLHRNIREDTGAKIITGTALASHRDAVNSGTNSVLKDTFVYRYTMELIKNVHDAKVEAKSPESILYRLLHSRKSIRTKMKEILAVIDEHYDPNEDLMDFVQFDCWKRVVSLNADTIDSISGLHRMLSLEECQHIDVTVPDALQEFSGRVRAVNAFSVRVLNTPYKKSLEKYDNVSLASASFTHVAGSSERSHKPYSNKSVAMSLTDEMTRAIKYAVYYAQVIPLMVFVQVRPEDTIRTTKVLEYGEAHSDKKYARGLPYKIANSHHEYIPNTVSYIDPSAIVDMRALMMIPGSHGPLFETSKNMGPDYPRESWVANTPIYKSERHQIDADDIRASSVTSTPVQSPRKQGSVMKAMLSKHSGEYHEPAVGDHVVYEWNKGEFYTGIIVGMSKKRREPTIEFEDGDSVTFLGHWLNEDNYKSLWWYQPRDDE